jgi:hypothetical protein
MVKKRLGKKDKKGWRDKILVHLKKFTPSYTRIQGLNLWMKNLTL